VVHGDESVSGSSDVQIALEVLASQLRALISVRAPDHVFVHAGVVGYGGRAIVIPGSSFSGKTTLVAELVRAGAIYYSDEYAVLDEAGRVHPYAKPLSIRSGGVSQVDHSVEAIGGSAGTDALEIGLLVVSSYSPDAVWSPRQLSSGEAVLAVLEHTIPAQERPQQAMATITKAVQGAVALQGERGEASAIVPELLASVSGAGAPSA
jgi:serine kinase of HPr protein (carbohydrate metabolism regulator)